MSVSFPPRKIKIVNADIEFDITVTDLEHERMLEIFNEQEMSPLIRLRVSSPGGGVAEFTNLSLHKERSLYD